MKKTLIRISSILGAIACAIAVLFVPFSHKIEPKNILSASASDSLVATEFVGSNLLIPVNVYGDIYCVQLRVRIVSDGYYISVWNEESSKILLTYSNGTARMYYFNDYFTFEVNSSPNFNFLTIQRVRILGYVYNGSLYNGVQYYDSNNRLLSVVNVSAPSSSNMAQYEVYDDRTYILGDSLSDSEQYNIGYTMGYSAGETAGYSSGETAGYDSGYGQGVAVGYNNGYNDGVEYGGDYTFTSLVSSFVDVPVQTFIGLFNFELLGVNLAGFFTGLMTLAFIITIVRLLKG